MKLNLTKGLLRRIGNMALSTLTALTLASCGGGGGSPGTVPGSASTPGSTSTPGNTSTVNAVGSIALTFSSPQLNSAGAAGTEVNVTALIKSAGNTAMTSVPVTFQASSGALTVVDASSDSNGRAKAVLSTSGDSTNRRITVTVQAGGQTASGTVDVVGTTVSAVGPNSIPSGGTGDVTITVLDSANAPLSNVPVSFSSKNGNPVVVKTSNGGVAAAPLTTAQGKVVLTVTAAKSGNDVISVSTQGANAVVPIEVNASKLTLSLVDGNGNATTTAATSTSCQQISAHYEIAGVPQNGTVNISTSRGSIYTDNTCSTALNSSSVSISSGDSQPIYLKSPTAGMATVTATVPNGPIAQASIEFIAELTPLATINLQNAPAVIGTNSGSAQSERSTLTAVVRDGTTYNNLVKNAVVEFSVITDGSGGALLNPAVVTTGSNGAATAVFVAGAASTPNDGVLIQAKIQGTNKTATTTLTVSKKSLFITAGTGNSLSAPSDTTYQQNFLVLINDSSGNPVEGATVTTSVAPTRYAKGDYIYDATAKSWVQSNVSVCANEDVNQNGILDAGEDFNSSGKLDPGIPVTVTASATTDATGTAKISLIYPKDRANWIEVQLNIRGTVSGTESTYQVAPFFLTGLATDYTNQAVSPPGYISPYGVNPCNQPN